MRKIIPNYDGPLDNIFIEISEMTTPYAHSAGITPNMITTLSNITCIITVLLLLNSNYYWAAFFILVSYYFDCMDGHMARKYDMVTVFGDYYDHISDLTKIVVVLATLYYIDSNKFFKVFPIIILMGVMMAVHMGCQELLYENNESYTLEPTKELCPVKNKTDDNMVQNVMESTKFFGCGTFYLTISLSIIYYNV